MNIRLLRLLCTALFMGRAWQHLRWDAPYRALLWDQQWLEALLARMGWQWSAYLDGPMSDASVQQLTQWVGGFYLCCAAFSVLTPPREKGQPWLQKIGHLFLWVGAGALCLLALLYVKDRGGQWPLLLEYTIQCGLPLCLSYALKGMTGPRYRRGITWLVAACFLGHGLYALGWPWPQPAGFVSMSMHLLGMSEWTARRFLWVMGLLDLVFVVGLCWQKMPPQWLLYGVIWGFLTALARWLAHIDLPGMGLEQWLHEVLVRLGHGGLVWVLMREWRKISTSPFLKK